MAGQDTGNEAVLGRLLDNPQFVAALQSHPQENPPAVTTGDRIHHAVKGVLQKSGASESQALSIADTARRHAVRATGGPMRHILIVRHGATHLNNNDTSVDRIRGWKDIPLSPEGKKQAQKTGRSIANSGNEPDVIATSDLCRAEETAKIISKMCGVPVVLSTDGFRPWNVGKFAGQVSEKAIPILANYAKNKPDTPLPDGESFNQFRHRLFSALSALLRKYPGKYVAIVTHHRVERLLLAWKAAGHPDSGDIKIEVFNQKGEKTGGETPMEVPPERVHAVAAKGAGNGPAKANPGAPNPAAPGAADRKLGTDQRRGPVVASAR